MAALLALTHLFVFIITFLLAFVGLKHWNGTEKSKRRRYPPSMSSLPLVGSLPFLTDFAHLPEFFIKKSRELGSMFTFRIGSQLALVLNDREVVNETLLKQSLTFAGRETFYTERQIFNRNHKGIAGRNFDAEFRKYHFLYVSTLRKFGLGVRSITESRVFLELEALVDELKRTNGAVFNPKAISLSVVSNLICCILFGRRQDTANGLQNATRLAVSLPECMDPVLDVAPILRFIPTYWSNLEKIKKINAEYVEVIAEEIKNSVIDGAQESFVKSIIEKEGPEYDVENLVISLRELIMGGTETLLATLLWSFVLLANNPAVQDRLQKEIDEAIPRDHFPSYQDIDKLPFVNATILEIMRIRTVLPLSVPRLTVKDTEVGGYSVPAGTVVFPNLHAVHMDPAVFVEPDNFRPERFLDKQNNVAKDLVIPFSIGRRACLGETLARQELFLIISGLVQRFTIRPPDGVQAVEVGLCSDSVARRPGHFEIRMLPREDHI